MSIRDLFTKDDQRDSEIHDIGGESIDATPIDTATEGYAQDFENEEEDSSQTGNMDLSAIVQIQKQNLPNDELQRTYKLVASKGVNSDASPSEIIAFNLCKYYLTGNLENLVQASIMSQDLPVAQGPTQEDEEPVANVIRREVLNAALQVFQNPDLDPEERQRMKELLLNQQQSDQNPSQNPVIKMQMLIIQELAGDKSIELDKEYNKMLLSFPEMAPEMGVFQEYVFNKKAYVINQQQSRQKNRTYSNNWAPTMSR